MSNELTDVRCPCGDEYPADSYDAGFIAGSGMCQNCDAAMPPKDIPAPVEQAGGDERDFQAKGAQEVPSPVSKEYDRHLISLLRKGEALPGHQEEAADEIERLRDWNDHLNNTVLPNILNPNFLMLMKGGERLLDLCTKDGEFIGVSLNDMKDLFDWMVTHARIAPDPALWEISQQGEDLLGMPQPSPAPELPERGTQHRFGTNEQSCRHDFAGVWWNDNGETKTGRECRHCGFFVADVAEQAEAERPEVFGLERYRVEKTGQGFWPYCVRAGDGTRELFVGHLKQCKRVAAQLATAFEDGKFIAQHESIVGGLRAEITQLRQHKNDYMDAGQETYRALQNEIREREAEIARLDGLVSGRTAERDAALARVAELEACGAPALLAAADYFAERAKGPSPGWVTLSAVAKELRVRADKAPVAQAQQLHDLDKQCRDDVARALGLRPNQERGFAWSYLLASIKSCVKASEDSAQAQHSVPETTNEEANSFLRVADAGQFKDNAVAVRTAAVIIRSLLHRPALMQSIIRHRIGLTPEYEGQWHADLYGEDGEVQHHAEADTPDEAVRAVVALAAAPSQAQHSVPEGWVQSLPLKDHQPCKPNEDRANGYTIPIYSRPVLVEEALRKLRAVLCDPIGNVVIDGSDGDREEVQRALGMLAAAPGKEVPQAWLDVQAERRRQITTEGWTPEHDDLYCAAELPRAAAAYILNGANDEAPAIWPFSAKWWKPRDARSNYMRAGALILAEIERLDRAAAAGKEVGHE
ncbi:TPA: hypothetical protein ACV882_006521 [Pseudomonas aeruginosa]|uniref:hypothetical protein n=1 Tax=Pseudomonas aeruginosa TaxID=287 RepID=UPI0032B3A6C4